jgi:hypothetical protein
MTQESIRDYYSQFAYIDDDEFVLEDEILRVNKHTKIFTTIELKDGSKHQVEFDDLNGFIENNKGNLVEKPLLLV